MSALGVQTESGYIYVNVESIPYTSAEECQAAFNELTQSYEANPEFRTFQLELRTSLLFTIKNIQMNRIVKAIEYETMQINILTWSYN